MSANAAIFVPVPEEYIGLVIGRGGSNINRIKQETQTRIEKSPKRGELGGESGFYVTGGSEAGRKRAEQAIKRYVDSAKMSIEEAIPQKFVPLVIGKDRDCNFRTIEKEFDVKITWPKITRTEKHVIFNIKGDIRNCERAREMLRANLKRWQDNDCQKPVSPGASGSQKYSKEHVSRNVEVAKEYVPFIVGKKHRNIERFETKSGTTIKVPSVQKAEDQDDDKVTFRIFGSPENCDRAELLIRSQIVASKDKKLRDELGGDTHFTCFAYKNKKGRFHLKRDEDTPKLDGFLTGKRYRIETDDDENDDDETDDETGTEPQGEVSKKTISEIKEHLLTPLEKFSKIKDEKQLMADLWCHFGKVLVSNVDEVDTEKIFEPKGIEERIRKIINRTTLNNSEKNDYWKVSFEEGIDPSDVHEDRLPKAKEIVEDNSFPNFRLVHTQWRYDYAFVTPSERNVRLKLWEGLPSDGDDEPPVEVKYILRPVFVQDEDSIKAWICYPSTSVLRGEIITPDSEYDCRMKLRAGSRHVIDEDSICVKEDEWLANYLSNCKFDKENHHIDLPEKNDQEDQGFKCIFYREAKERMFEVFADEECFTVIVLDQQGWDSDAKAKRPQKQFGVRVVMNSWSDKLLSPEQHWTPEEILETKLETYLKFVSVLKDYLFG